MSKQTPAAPDYTGAANAQAQSSREVTEQQTWANRPTINTPFGQQTWEVKPVWDPSTGQYLNSWTQDTNLTPQSQAALDAQMNIQQGKSDIAQNMLGRVKSEYSQPMDWDSLTKLAGTPEGQQLNAEGVQRNIGNTPDYIKSAGDAIYNQWSDRQEPLMAQQKDQLRTSLYNQGLKEGDQAYDAEMKKLENQQSDARQQAQYQATIGSGQEAQRMQGMDVTQGQFANQASQQAFNQNAAAGQQNFGQNMQSANYQNALRQQQIAEQMQQRGFSLNEINAILNGQQVSMPNMPSFNQANASQAAQYNQAAQNQGQYNLDAFSAQQQQMNSLLSGAGSMAMMFSDRRLKKDIQPMPEKYDWPLFYKWYSYHYVWEDESDPYHIGVMADEVEEINPEAVYTRPDGYKMVDYGRL